TRRSSDLCNTPPRTALDFNRSAHTRFELLISQFSTNTLLQLPEISLPIAVPAWPSRIVQLRMIKFSHGTFTRRPSLLRPDLMAMQSSPVSNKHFSIKTSLQLSGSQPSLFGPCEKISTPRTVTFVHSNGCNSHIGERRIFTPSIKTFSQRLNSTKLGRKLKPSPNCRCSTGTPSVPIFTSFAFEGLALHGHQLDASAWLSRVPSP